MINLLWVSHFIKLTTESFQRLSVIEFLSFLCLLMKYLLEKNKNNWQQKDISVPHYCDCSKKSDKVSFHSKVARWWLCLHHHQLQAWTCSPVFSKIIREITVLLAQRQQGQVLCVHWRKGQAFVNLNSC